MKKELLIVILVVVGIIGISILLKYVIFKNYASELNDKNSDNLCQKLCGEGKFSFGRCGCDCSDGEKKIIVDELNNKGLRDKIQESCKIITENGTELPCVWTCCCK